ncbi:MAG: pitrilysin family protein [Oscillospiraceae bacterium]
MKMEVIKNARLDEQYHKITLDNGLTVLVYPMPQKEGVYALLGAKIGSTTRDFILGDKRVKVPSGIAHFLEHKLFENENEDAFELFAKTGANANAYTSYDKTCYLFSASINIEQSLRTLIRFVTAPHFTAETVDKEQGIIGQEIKMYDDNPDWALATMSLQSLYKKHPVRDDIAGSVESISEITPELLYTCYNAYYRPANMALSIAGNITAEQVLQICEEEYAGVGVPSETVETLAIDEPCDIVSKYCEKQMQVCAPQFCLGFKEQPHGAEKRAKRELACRIAMELIGGETSNLYRRMYDSGLVNDMFDASVLDAEDYLCIMFSGESEQPQKVVEEIYRELEEFKKNGIDEERFVECKRAFLGNYLCGYDSTETTATKMLYSHFKNASIYDTIDDIENISKEDIEQQIRSMFSKEQSSLSVIKPIKE